MRGERPHHRLPPAGRGQRQVPGQLLGPALAAARGRPAAGDSPLSELLRELIRAAGLVRRIGVNLNQAVARLNATGQRSGDLVPYAAESMRRAERLDAVADEVRKALR